MAKVESHDPEREAQFVLRRALVRTVQEPLLHFVIIGAVVFLAFGDRDRAMAPADPTPVIELTAVTRDRLVAQFRAVWNRDPTAAEQAGMIDGWLREEVLYREALALGLDRDDTVIRQRLRLKMEFLVDGMAGTMTPDEATLAAWFAERAQDFALPSALTFAQVTIDATDDPAALIRMLDTGTDPATVGRGSLLPPVMDMATAAAIDGAFGPGFHEALAAQPANQWAGPVTSAFGQHLVRVLARQPGTVPTLDAVRPQVLAAWRTAQSQVLRDAQFQALLARYRVVMPEDAAP